LAVKARDGGDSICLFPVRRYSYFFVIWGETHMRGMLLAGAAFLVMGQSAPARADDLVEMYKDFHQNPELSFMEEKTALKMADQFRKAGFTVTEKVGGYGVVGVLKNGAGPTLMIRADTDALPVKEDTGLAYASTATGKDREGNTYPIMHACGHDVHMTVLVGAARALAASRNSWKGTLVVIAQPAEERTGGARQMLADGLYTRFPKPDSVLALHTNSGLPAGAIGMVTGFALANVDSVDILVRGIGGHGAYPQTTKDPIVLASQIVTALQTLTSREVDPQDAAVVTVGHIVGGSKRNIISDEVKLELTVRSYEDSTRKKLLDGIARIAEGQARSAGLPPEKYPVVTMADDATPATYNTPGQTDRLMQVFTRKFGASRVIKTKPVMGGEDFSFFWLADKKIESTIFWLGAIKQSTYDASVKNGTQLPSLHSALFAPDPEPTLKTGVEAMTTAALDIFNTKN
jgi:amidohydrolase